MTKRSDAVRLGSHGGKAAAKNMTKEERVKRATKASIAALPAEGNAVRFNGKRITYRQAGDMIGVTRQHAWYLHKRGQLIPRLKKAVHN